MKVLVDTNVLLDVLCHRKPFWDSSLPIWGLSESQQIMGIVSALSVANLIYIMRKELNPERIPEIVRQISLVFTVSDLRADDLNTAAEMQWKDYEDALQMVCAARNHADFMITRNIRDFAESPVPAITPEDFLKQIFPYR